MSKKPDIFKMVLAEKTEEGIVKAIGEPEERETKYGKSIRLPITVSIKGVDVTVSIMFSAKTLRTGLWHPKSNIYRLLTRYGARTLNELVGKKVQVKIDDAGFYRIVI